MRPRRAAATAGLTAIAVLALAGASPAGAAGLEGFERCGKVADEGGPSPVEAANVRCERALKVAARFIQSDDLAQGWKTYNPAGCEFFAYKRGDRRELLDWFEDREPLETKVIYFIKTRGCVS